MEPNISSPSNEKLKAWLKLSDSKAIKKSRQFLFHDFELLEEVFSQKTSLNSNFLGLITSERSDFPKLYQNQPVYRLKKELFSKLDLFQLNSPIGIFEYQKFPEFEYSPTISSPEIFLPLGDPLNLGASLRNILAFNFQKVILLKESAHPFHPKSLYASRGAGLFLDLKSGPSIQDLDFDILALDRGGENLHQFEWPKNFRLLLGEEGPGVPKLKNLKKIEVPIGPLTESLNAMAALSIALYSYRTQYSLK